MNFCPSPPLQSQPPITTSPDPTTPLCLKSRPCKTLSYSPELEHSRRRESIGPPQGKVTEVIESASRSPPGLGTVPLESIWVPCWCHFEVTFGALRTMADTCCNTCVLLVTFLSPNPPTMKIRHPRHSNAICPIVHFSKS